jgi:hypothetical protein
VRTREEIVREMMDSKPASVAPWTFWDNVVHKVTGRVSSRAYAERMVSMAMDDARHERFRRELAMLESRRFGRWTVVICGSIDYPERLRSAADFELAMGHRVLMPDDVSPGSQPTPDARDRHRERIKEADEVVVVVGEDCRIGHHTALEVRDATNLGDKPIRLRMELLK